MRTSSCQTCGCVLQYESGLYGPPGWFDPQTVDLDNTGTTCPVSGDEHLPGEIRDSAAVDS